MDNVRPYDETDPTPEWEARLSRALGLMARSSALLGKAMGRDLLAEDLVEDVAEEAKDVKPRSGQEFTAILAAFQDLSIDARATMTPRWIPTTPKAIAEMRRLGLVTETEARDLATAHNPRRGTLTQWGHGAWCVFDGARWVACVDEEAAITLSQRWLDEERR